MPEVRALYLAGAINLIVAAIQPGAIGAPHQTRLTCVNPASGASWQIRVDFDKSTVDDFVARISATQISWRDTKARSNYILDRKSGELTMVAPSSTGGYFLHHRCKL